jgi:6-phosphogluconolactonase
MIHVFPDATAVARESAQRFAEIARAAIEARGIFTVALSGGSTPKLMFSMLAAESFLTPAEWTKVQFFWSDERCVPPDHPDSNYRMANEALLSKIAISPDQVHRMHGEEVPPDAAAVAYATLVAGMKFDLILLGMGPDGHTASLFPGSKALHETKAPAVANWVEKFKTWRLTMTAPFINQAAIVMFQIAGAEKAPALKEVLEGVRIPELYPAQLIQPSDGDIEWMLDQAASAKLHG